MGGEPRSARPKIVSVANQKGGVGKTTTSVNLAACLAELGQRVVLVDMDPQGNASSGVGFERDDCERSVYDAMIGEASLDEVIYATETENLLLIPSTTDLAGAEIELVDHDEREFVLRGAMAAMEREADFVILDCPPSLGLLTLNALAASDSVLVPIQTEYYALEGLGHLLRTIELIREHLNPGLKLEGFLLTMYDGRTNLSDQVAGEVRAHFADLVYDARIPRNVRLSEAPSFGQSALHYDRSSRGAQAYLRFAREFMHRNGRRPGRASA